MGEAELQALEAADRWERARSRQATRKAMADAETELARAVERLRKARGTP